VPRSGVRVSGHGGLLEGAHVFHNTSVTLLRPEAQTGGRGVGHVPARAVPAGRTLAGCDRSHHRRQACPRLDPDRPRTGHHPVHRSRRRPLRNELAPWVVRRAGEAVRLFVAVDGSGRMSLPIRRSSSRGLIVLCPAGPGPRVTGASWAALLTVGCLLLGLSSVVTPPAQAATVPTAVEGAPGRGVAGVGLLGVDAGEDRAFDPDGIWPRWRCAARSPPCRTARRSGCASTAPASLTGRARARTPRWSLRSPRWTAPRSTPRSPP
jgi:hypothetical protein